MIHILDGRNWNRLVVHIDSEDYYADGYEQGLDGENSGYFSVNADHIAAPYLKDRFRFLRKNRQGRWQEYVAYKISTKSAGRLTVLATGAEQEIDALKIMHAGRYEAETLEAMALRVLAGTGYKIGRIDFASYQTETIENAVGGYAFLKRLGNYFDRELRFYVEVQGTKILGRYMDMVERVGRDNRELISFGDNLSELERIVHTDRIVTKLECRGPEREDGSRLTAEVTDIEAFQRWNLNGNHLVGYYEPDSADGEMTQERLQQLGEMELKKRINRVVEYIASVAVLPEDDYALGDTVLIEDTSFNPPLYAESRVIHEQGPFEYNPDDVTDLQYKFGEVEEFDADDLRSEFKRLQERFAFKTIRQVEEPPVQPRTIWLKPRTLEEQQTVAMFSLMSAASAFDIPHIADMESEAWVKMSPEQAEEINGLELGKEYNKVSIDKYRGLNITGVESEPIGTIDGENDAYTLPHLEAASITAPNVLRYADYSESPALYCVASQSTSGIGEPSDDNEGTSWSKPLRTVKEALRRIAPSFKGEASVHIAYGQTFYEDIDISGFTGGGTLIIRKSADTTRPKIAGSVIMENNVNRVEWRDINLDSTANYAGFFIRNTKGAIVNTNINGATGETTSGINANAGAAFELLNLNFSNIVTAVRASYGGSAYCVNHTGTVSGSVYVAFGGGVISGSGTAPTGSSLKSEIQGGIVTGTWSIPSPPTPPAPSPITVKNSWNAQSDSGTWRADENRYDIYGASVNNVTQGAYSGYGPFTGAWFFGSAPSSAVSGKTIKSIRLYAGRVSGGSGSAVGVRFRPHTSASRPSGRVSLQSPESIHNFRVGEDKWITLPSSFHAGFANGTFKGIAIYSGSSAYAKMKKTAKLEITYED